MVAENLEPIETGNPPQSDSNTSEQQQSFRPVIDSTRKPGVTHNQISHRLEKVRGFGAISSTLRADFAYAKRQRASQFINHVRERRPQTRAVSTKKAASSWQQMDMTLPNGAVLSEGSGIPSLGEMRTPPAASQPLPPVSNEESAFVKRLRQATGTAPKPAPTRQAKKPDPRSRLFSRIDEVTPGPVNDPRRPTPSAPSGIPDSPQEKPAPFPKEETGPDTVSRTLQSPARSEPHRERSSAPREIEVPPVERRSDAAEPVFTSKERAASPHRVVEEKAQREKTGPAAPERTKPVSHIQPDSPPRVQRQREENPPRTVQPDEGSRQEPPRPPRRETPVRAKEDETPLPDKPIRQAASTPPPQKPVAPSPGREIETRMEQPLRTPPARSAPKETPEPAADKPIRKSAEHQKTAEKQPLAHRRPDAKLTPPQPTSPPETRLTAPDAETETSLPVFMPKPPENRRFLSRSVFKPLTTHRQAKPITLRSASQPPLNYVQRAPEKIRTAPFRQAKPIILRSTSRPPLNYVQRAPEKVKTTPFRQTKPIIRRSASRPPLNVVQRAPEKVRTTPFRQSPPARDAKQQPVSMRSETPSAAASQTAAKKPAPLQPKAQIPGSPQPVMEQSEKPDLLVLRQTEPESVETPDSRPAAFPQGKTNRQQSLAPAARQKRIELKMGSFPRSQTRAGIFPRPATAVPKAVVRRRMTSPDGRQSRPVRQVEFPLAGTGDHPAAAAGTGKGTLSGLPTGREHIFVRKPLLKGTAGAQLHVPVIMPPVAGKKPDQVTFASRRTVSKHSPDKGLPRPADGSVPLPGPDAFAWTQNSVDAEPVVRRQIHETNAESPRSGEDISMPVVKNDHAKTNEPETQAVQGSPQLSDENAGQQPQQDTLAEASSPEVYQWKETGHQDVPAPNLASLARGVFPIIRRMLEVEKERSSGNRF